MTATATLPMGGFYQFGFVTRNLDAAIETLRRDFNVTQFRRQRTTPSMEAIHAWTGTTQIEVLELGEGAPQMYLDYLPDQPGELRLQHLGKRIDTVAEWEQLEAAIERLGLETPLKATVMDGHLRAVYVDTRALLGIYSEYVCFTGPALNIYDNVPQNG